MSTEQDLLAELTSGDDERAEAAVSRLGKLGPAAVPALGKLLSSPVEDSRWWAARALAEIPSPQTPPLLISALGDESPAVRQCAALGLRKQPDSLAMPALIQALEDEDAMCRYLAGDALVAIGGPAVDGLIEVMQRGSQAARLEAVRALAEIGDDRSIPALFAALGEESALMEYWANEGLERMGVGTVFFKP